MSYKENAKKMRKNLVMSEKSSNFASAFEKNPIRVRRRPCLLKAKTLEATDRANLSRTITRCSNFFAPKSKMISENLISK